MKTNSLINVIEGAALGAFITYGLIKYFEKHTIKEVAEPEKDLDKEIEIELYNHDRLLDLYIKDDVVDYIDFSRRGHLPIIVG